MIGFLRRLLRLGKLPGDMRAEVEGEGLIHLAECVGVVLRFTGEVPGRKSVGLTRGYAGALALTNRRLLATMSTVPGKAGRAADQPWGEGGSGAVVGTLSESGLRLAVDDLSRVDPAFSGALSLTYNTELSAEVLGRVPTRSISFDVPTVFVYRVLGIPRT